MHVIGKFDSTQIVEYIVVQGRGRSDVFALQ